MADTVQTDVSISNTWSKIAEDTEFFMMTLARNKPVALAFKGTDEAPTASGHILDPEDLESRGFLRNAGGPPGFVYARTIEEGDEFSLRMSIWTE